MIISTITGIACLVAIYIAYRLHKKSTFLEQELKQANSKIKSAYVKFGKTFEHFAPFTNKFPSKENAVFLGCPIDYICFDQDSIKFIDVKTGFAQLSPKQKFIKKQIEEGKVKFLELRY